MPPSERRLTSAWSLIEALNLASSRREGNQYCAERPARQCRPSAAMESDARTLSSAAGAAPVISAADRSRQAAVPIYCQSETLAASHTEKAERRQPRETWVLCVVVGSAEPMRRDQLSAGFGSRQVTPLLQLDRVVFLHF